MADERQPAVAAGRSEGRLLFPAGKLRACLLCKPSGASGGGVVEHVWCSAKDTAPLPEKTLQACASKVVAGHLFASPEQLVQRPVPGPSASSEPFMQMLRTEEVLLCTMGFMSEEGDGVSTITTVSLVFNAACTGVVLALRDAISNRLSWLSLLALEFLRQAPSPWESMGPRVERELVNTAALVEEGVASRPSLNAGSYLSIWKQPVEASVDFLCLAVSAHLSRNGCSVVVGDDVRTVNRMVDTLSFFCRSEHLASIRHARQGLPYVPDVRLQGVAKPKTVGEARLAQSSWPSALINLTTKEVQCSGDVASHKVIWTGSRAVELKRAVKVTSKEVYKCTLCAARVSPMAASLVRDLFSLPPSLRPAGAIHIERLLHHRAMVLVAFLQAAKLVGWDENDRYLLTSIPERSFVQRLRVELHLLDDVDWEIILCATERILPGSLSALSVPTGRRQRK